MIKKLRLKFICVLMLIVTVMLSVILSLVVHFTGSVMEMQSISMMRQVGSAPFRPAAPGKNNEMMPMAFFTVQLDRDGKITNATGEYYDLSDTVKLQQIVNLALSRNEETGELKEYDLRFFKASSAWGEKIVFTDITTEKQTIQNMLYACFVIGGVAFVIFLVLSVFLSHWVVKPVETAWTQQRQFVADASHELKTPLSVIMANAELLQGEEYSQAEKNGFSQSILTMTYQMRSLVENMLEMARVDNGAMDQKRQQLDLSQLVTDAVLSVGLLYEEQDLHLESTIAENVTIMGNESQLYQVMDVLLDNARKYSTPGGTVYVTLQSIGYSCVMCVASPGDPLEKEELKNIFKRFYRGDKARAINGSYGLGLPIAQSIVEAHRGKIWAESKEGYNIFRVQLPRV